MFPAGANDEYFLALFLPVPARMFSLRHYFLPVTAGLFVLLFTFYAYNRSLHSFHSRREKLFEVKTDEAAAAIQARMLQHIQILKGAKGLWQSSDSLTRDKWRAYYYTLQLTEWYPGIQGMGYAQRVHDAEAHEEALRKQGHLDYKLSPEGKRDVYFPIVYIEPFSGRNLRAFGYDMYSEPVRRRAMDQARDTDLPTLTPLVTLVQETDTAVQPGFLVYLPIYSEPSGTVEERKENLQGFVYAPFRTYDLMNAILGERYNDLDIEVYDDTVMAASTLLYSKADSIAFGERLKEEQLGRVTSIKVMNRSFYVYFTTRSDFGSSTERQQPIVIFAGGTVIALLLFFAIAAMSNTNRRASSLAADLTARYSESEERLQSIIRNAPDAVVVIDRNSKILQWNPKAEDIFGYTSSEALGKHINELIVPERYREAHNAGMKRYMSTGKGNIINKTIEISAMNKQGVEFPIDISISATVFRDENIFISFISDISERKRTESELIKRTVDLERSRELERKKDEFLGVASHELKTPLTSAKAYVQLLERLLIEEQCSPAAAQYIIKANNYIDKLNRLISDLLDATKIQSGKLMFRLENISLDEFINECVENMQQVSAQHKLYLEARTGAIVRGDRQRLEQVIVNMLNNAIKYSPNSNRIDIKVEREGSRAKVSVRDYGIGIDELNLQKIFSRFYRVEKDSSKFQGLGLGLYISREIIERHNGEMWAESKPGEGSVFYFTLPLQEES
jgi:PAS domain S-box-containing protein